MAAGGTDRNPVEVLSEEFLERIRRGEAVTPEDYAAQASRAGRRDPRAVPGAPDDGRPGRRDLATAPSSIAGDAGAIAGATAGRLGEFRLLREVGRGGMGVVYEAEQESLGRRVALKVLPHGALTDTKQVRRFEREARSAARLHHTNIVPVFGVGEHEGTHYYVMQFIQGQGLDAVLDELKRLRDAPRGEASRAAPAADRPDQGATAAEIARSLVTGRFAAGAGTRRRRSARTRHAAWSGRPMPPAGLGRHRDPSAVGQSATSGVSTLRRDRPPVRPGRGADRRPGRRGAGVRPRPGHPPPRHQAVEPAPGPRGQRLGGRLRAGQGDRRRRPDAHRRHRRHGAVHGPGAVPGRGRRAGRHLRPGADALRDAGLAAGVRRDRPRQLDPPGDAGRPAPAAQAEPARPARPGDDHPQGDRPRPGQRYRDGPGDGRGPCSGSWTAGRSWRGGSRRPSGLSLVPAEPRAGGVARPGRPAAGGEVRRLDRRGGHGSATSPRPPGRSPTPRIAQPGRRGTAPGRRRGQVAESPPASKPTPSAHRAGEAWPKRGQLRAGPQGRGRLVHEGQRKHAV